MKNYLTQLAVAKIDSVSDPNSAGGDGLDTTVQQIVSNVIAVLGVVAVVVILYGGISYMTSTGDPGKTKKAKDTILYGAIGLIICALAFVIVNFVIGNILGASSGGSGARVSCDSFSGQAKTTCEACQSGRASAGTDCSLYN